MTLGELIKSYREKHKISMDKFSDLSGISKAYISMLEKNENSRSKKPIVPSLATIKAVADAIKMDLNDLLAVLDENTPISLENDVFEQKTADEARAKMRAFEAKINQLSDKKVKSLDNYLDFLIEQQKNEKGE